MHKRCFRYSQHAIVLHIALPQGASFANRILQRKWGVFATRFADSLPCREFAEGRESRPLRRGQAQGDTFSKC